MAHEHEAPRQDEENNKKPDGENNSDQDPDEDKGKQGDEGKKDTEEKPDKKPVESPYHDDEDEEDDSDEDDDDEDDDDKSSVPLHKHQKVKEKYRELKRELKTMREGGDPSASKVKAVAQKYGVKEEFVTELVEAANSIAEQRFDEKYGKRFEEQEREKIENAFSKEFSKVVKNHPVLEGKEEAIRALAYSPKYKNKSIEDIARELYGDQMGKTSSETPRRGTSERQVETIDFATMDKATRERVFKDPKLRAQYYDWADKNNL